MYIDPNTGGMLFQALAVAFAAVTGFFMIFSGKIRAAIARMRRKAGPKPDETVDEKPAE